MTYRLPPEFWAAIDQPTKRMIGKYRDLGRVVVDETDRAYSLGAADAFRDMFNLLLDMTDDQSTPIVRRLREALREANDRRSG